jgi:acyl transferase domain-containing protein
MALAGAIELRTPRMTGQTYTPDGIFTADGKCRPFSSEATGTMFSDEAGIVVLKRFQDAVADGDTIHAVIIGSAVNHDGARKRNYLASSVKAQVELITAAQVKARVPPEDITYIEAHGTGTPLEDPVEFEALKQVFESGSTKRNHCRGFRRCE